MQELTTGYDYDSLDAPTGLLVKQSADKIHARMDAARQDLIEVGRELIAVSNLLPHGEFLKWIDAEFAWHKTTAYDFMSVAERFGDKFPPGGNFHAKALYLLAGPKVPDKARQIAVERAQAGETITLPVAQEIVAASKPSRAPRQKDQVTQTEDAGTFVIEASSPSFSWEALDLACASVVKQLQLALLAFPDRSGDALASLGDELRNWRKRFGAWTDGLPSGRPQEDAVLLFPCVGTGAKEWPLLPSKLAEYVESFPGVDVLAQCRAARQWLLDNPARRKTFKGMAKFLGGWLGRKQDGGTPANGKAVRTPETVTDIFARNAAAMGMQ